jgi:hypothetical protein
VSKNEGIQGNVQADVVAVGKGAQAVKVVHEAFDRGALQAALRQMRAEIAGLQLSPLEHETLQHDLGHLDEQVKAPEPDRDRIGGLLAGLAAKLKLVGVVLTEGVGLGESFKKISVLLHLSLKALGIGS